MDTVQTIACDGKSWAMNLSSLFVVQVADHHELSEKAVGQQETTNLVMSTVREPLGTKAGKFIMKVNVFLHVSSISFLCLKYLKHEVSVFQMKVFASRGLTISSNGFKWSFRSLKFSSYS